MNSHCATSGTLGERLWNVRVGVVVTLDRVFGRIGSLVWGVRVTPGGNAGVPTVHAPFVR